VEDHVMIGKPGFLQLWQEIVLTLLLKGAFLVIIWMAWFSGTENRALSGNKVAVQILSPQPESPQFKSPQLQKEQNHDAVPRAR
jgi:hypothetical protein